MGYQIYERNNIILPLPVLNYHVSEEIVLPDIFLLLQKSIILSYNYNCKDGSKCVYPIYLQYSIV